MNSTLLKLVPAAVALVLGAVVLTLALRAGLTAGADDTLRSEPLVVGEVHALTLNEGIVPFRNTTATVSVESEEPVFLGVANPVDVASYLGGVAVEEITEVQVPGELSHRQVPGENEPPAPPGDLDWWAGSQTGTSVAHSFDVDAEPGMVVLLGAEGQPIEDARVTVTVETDGVFGLSLMGVALASLLFGVAAFLALTWWYDRIRLAPRRSAGERRFPRRPAERGAPSRLDRRGRDRSSGAAGVLGGLRNRVAGAGRAVRPGASRRSSGSRRRR
ncbi:hypothetical protein [Sediminivirga luteola]|uniref:Uncharacterized protein n=1 Tax=Sediminivirga luteola TaxID=1774748 RepID=A0A8J2TXF7_9MICO|nr:hypothetical protein [Sediminivirga luteola]GGA12559.1 hypothetical protein GCM10011333_14300 [Sediminivirga luteola]